MIRFISETKSGGSTCSALASVACGQAQVFPFAAGRLLHRACVAVALFLSFAVTSFATEHLSLEGKWRFALGGPAPAFPQDKLPELHFEDAIMLPGTTETRQKGPENPAREQGMLTRIRKFDGPAWYQRDVTIPAAWAASSAIAA